MQAESVSYPVHKIVLVIHQQDNHGALSFV